MSALHLPSLMDLLLVVRNTLVIYLFLILVLRVFGRRQLGQLNVVDLVVIIIMGSAVETAMINGNVSLPAGLVCAATLLLADRLFARTLLRSTRLNHLVTGNPILLIHDGQFVDAHLRKAGLTRADVLEALRERETAGVEEVKLAVLEVDGTINVVPMDEPALQSKKGEEFRQDEQD